MLFYGPSAREGGGLRAQPLDALGQLRGRSVEVWREDISDVNPLAPHALEVAAASGGGRVGVAWVARHGREVRVHVSRGTGTSFSPAEDLGESELPPMIVRGNVAMAAAADGSLSLIHRTTRGPCVDGVPGECARLRITRIGDDGASDRRGLALVIPEVCDRPVPGYVWADGTWYYSICAQSEGAPATTVYAIQFEPSYAQADRIFAGCEALGLGRVGEGAAVALGRCAGGRVDGVRYADAGSNKLVLVGLSRRVVCSEGRPHVVLGGDPGGDQLDLPLNEATADLSALLPEAMARPRSRAVWTGEALLVAVPLGAEVALHRYQCEHGEFVRTSAF